MSTATLTITDRREQSRGFEYVVDCEHGTTTASLLGPFRADLLGSAVAIQKHYAEEQCRCTRKLRKIYPPGLIEVEAARIQMLRDKS